MYVCVPEGLERKKGWRFVGLGCGDWVRRGGDGEGGRYGISYFFWCVGLWIPLYFYPLALGVCEFKCIPTLFKVHKDFLKQSATKKITPL